MSVVILQDEIIHYEFLGRGRPLIFLHGWVGSWRYWVPTMQASCVSFRTYALDLWGFGGSGRSPEFYTIEQQVGLLEQFLQLLGIGKIALVGHGLGSIVALTFATRYPNLVDRLMIIGWPDHLGSLNERLHTDTLTDLVDWLLGRAAVEEMVRVEALRADPKAIQFSFNDLLHVDLTKLLAALATPCLMVHGQNDPLVTGPSQEQTATFPEHIHQIVFEQSGHFPMLDEANKFNRLLADFLALNSGESPRQLQLKEEWKRRIR